MSAEKRIGNLKRLCRQFQLANEKRKKQAVQDYAFKELLRKKNKVLYDQISNELILDNVSRIYQEIIPVMRIVFTAAEILKAVESFKISKENDSFVDWVKSLETYDVIENKWNSVGGISYPDSAKISVDAQYVYYRYAIGGGKINGRY